MGWFVRRFYLKSSKVAAEIMYWCFTCSIWRFLFASFLFFGVLNVFFAFMIMACVAKAPKCLSPSLEDLGFREQFNDALHLSWTTFSTVGYGIISPSTGGSSAFMENPDFFNEEGRCLLVSFLLSFESLLGVLCVG